MTKSRIMFAALMSIFFFEYSFSAKHVSKNPNSTSAINSTRSSSTQQKTGFTENEIVLLKGVANKIKNDMEYAGQYLKYAEQIKEERIFRAVESLFSVVPSLLSYLYCSIYVSKFLHRYLSEGVLLTATTILSSQVISGKLNKFGGFLYNISFRRVLRHIFSKVYNYIYE